MATPILSIIQVTAPPWFTEIPVFSIDAVKPAVLATSTIQPDLSSPTSRAVKHDYGDCAILPAGHGPVPKYDNTRGFYHSREIHDAAKKAHTPPGYIKSFISATGSYVGAIYLGHYELESFDTHECARRCTEHGQLVNATQPSVPTGTSAAAAAKTTETGYAQQTPEETCEGFNVYFERSPTIHLGPHCPDAPSRTLIKCAIWGEPLHEEKATNTGYREWDFDVAIAGSNGYSLAKHGKGGKSMAACGKRVAKTLLAAVFVGHVLWGLGMF
ncbi:hypothetical protein ACJQWK_06291 [Exserohilum turcicum]|uniref:Uncharacterized protein n=1 Tax=Exserohilum turcicum (strain 28A) TaxID=671987 RepID=R0JW98_EXST2|nr:uncharacterized protein SETTUDRAFT_32441 [Exserohilum turcica Et28A]EOA85223.1 hypothetical protein SETTUDRAFT_32441 [Exserohilum turcica Et28A]